MTRQPMRHNRRGVSLVIVAIFLFVLVGMSALAIDLGMLQKVRAEAQRAADAAALAGASAYLLDLSVAAETTEAGHRARQAADTNYMAGIKIDSLSELTVWAIPESLKIRVRVRRASVRTWFANIFGTYAVPVGAKAAAVADYASGAKCVKPIALPDLWDDAGDMNNNRLPDAGETWQYLNPPTPDTYYRAGYDGVDGSGTGFGSSWRDLVAVPNLNLRDWGLRIVLRPSVNPGDASLPCPGDLQGGKCYIPGWWGLWGDPGLTDDMLRACTPLSTKPALDTTTYSIGTAYDTKTGWTAVSKIFEDLISLDPGAYWDPLGTDAQTGKEGTVVSPTFGDNWRASPRVWMLGIFDPNHIPAPNEQVTFNNLMTFFVEGCMNENGMGGFNSPVKCKTNDILVGRFLGLAKGTATGPSPGTMTRILRLVE
jgi:hypothetical protein